MARYVTRPGGYDLSLAGPFHNRSAKMHVHVLDARLASLSATLNRYIKPFRPKGSFYLPLGDRVVLTCADIEEGRAGDESLGSMHEVEVAFFVLALYCDPLPRRVVSFAPYLFVNNAWAMVMGREVHGFRKDLATSFSTVDVDGAGWRGLPGDIEHVETWTMPVTGKGSRLARAKVLEIRAPETQGPHAPASGPFAGEELIRALIGSGPAGLGAELPGPLREALAGPGALAVVAGLLAALAKTTSAVDLRLLFLRQFRDPEQSENAAVQGLTEAIANATLSATPTVLPPSSVCLHHAASHPIAVELGLANETWIEAELSLELSLDFVLHDAIP